MTDITLSYIVGLVQNGLDFIFSNIAVAIGFYIFAGFMGWYILGDVLNVDDKTHKIYTIFMMVLLIFGLFVMVDKGIIDLSSIWKYLTNKL